VATLFSHRLLVLAARERGGGGGYGGTTQICLSSTPTP